MSNAYDIIAKAHREQRLPPGYSTVTQFVADVLKHVAPDERQAAVRMLDDWGAMRRGAHDVFKPTPTEKDFGRAHGVEMHPEAVKLADDLHQHLFDEDIAHGLMSRMGTDIQQPQSEPTSLRDVVAASVEVFNGDPHE